MTDDPIEIVARAATILDRLGIPYVIGGSLASAAYGSVRTTADADLVIELREDQIDSLARELGAGFYVSPDAMRDAVRSRDSFNAISLDAPFKIDFFVLGGSRFDREEFRRRVSKEMGEDGRFRLMLKTPEDMILRKLSWFRAGGEVSERQWDDVLNVLAVCHRDLDAAYLDRWAAELGVADLLAKARAQCEG
ncbi:MAG TPA: hypothetical protein VGK89_06065 [Candidatus Eisenbacteria bacterium]|jgi:hypothetical protein